MLLRKFKLDLIYFIISIVIAFYCSYSNFKKNVDYSFLKIRQEFSREIAKQTKILTYLDKNIQTQNINFKEKLVGLLRDIEDFFYVFQSNYSPFPASINIVYPEPYNEIVGSFGRKGYSSLAPDLDYYYKCNSSTTNIYLSKPYMDPNIEDLYLIHIGKGVRDNGSGLTACLDMKFSLSMFLGESLGSIDKILPGKIAVISDNNNIFLFNRHKKNFDDAFDNKDRLIKFPLDNKDKIYIGIKIGNLEFLQYLFLSSISNIKIFFYFYVFMKLLHFFWQRHINKQINNCFKDIFATLDLDFNSFKGKYCITDMYDSIKSKISQILNKKHRLLNEYREVKQNLQSNQNYINKLEMIQVKYENLSESLLLQNKYGTMLAQDSQELYVLMEQKINILIENIIGNLDFKLSKDKIVLYLTNIIDNLFLHKVGVVLTKKLLLCMDEIIDDAIVLNKIISTNKNIKIIKKIKHKLPAVYSCEQPLLKMISSIIYQLIKNSPDSANIFITTNINVKHLHLTIRDDSFGYLDFNSMDERVLENVYDIRSSSWKNIQLIAKFLEIDITINNIQYEGNVVEIIMPISDKSPDEVNLEKSNIVTAFV